MAFNDESLPTWFIIFDLSDPVIIIVNKLIHG